MICSELHLPVPVIVLGWRQSPVDPAPALEWSVTLWTLGLRLRLGPPRHCLLGCKGVIVLDPWTHLRSQGVCSYHTTPTADSNTAGLRAEQARVWGTHGRDPRIFFLTTLQLLLVSLMYFTGAFYEGLVGTQRRPKGGFCSVISLSEPSVPPKWGDSFPSLLENLQAINRPLHRQRN